MILIDGSAGEGGGQILRSALALSLITPHAATNIALIRRFLPVEIVAAPDGKDASRVEVRPRDGGGSAREG